MEFPGETEKSGEYIVMDTLGPTPSLDEGERVGLVSPTGASKKSQKAQQRARFSSKPTLALLDVSLSCDYMCILYSLSLSCGRLDQLKPSAQKIK